MVGPNKHYLNTSDTFSFLLSLFLPSPSSLCLVITVIKWYLSCTPATLFLLLWRAFPQITMPCGSYFVYYISQLTLTVYTQYFTSI